MIHLNYTLFLKSILNGFKFIECEFYLSTSSFTGSP
jgi:hypothetical protein